MQFMQFKPEYRRENFSDFWLFGDKTQGFLIDIVQFKGSRTNDYRLRRLEKCFDLHGLIFLGAIVAGLYKSFSSDGSEGLPFSPRSPHSLLRGAMTMPVLPGCCGLICKG